jgi:hypothetical protein
MKALSLALLLLIAPAAFAGGIIHLLAYKPAPCCALFAVNDLPYTFVTGFDSVTGDIQGVCGYTNGRSQAWFNCEWDLTGKPLSIGSRILPPPQPVYGALMWFYNEPEFVVATDSNGNHIGVLDGSPRIAVLTTP